MQGALIPLGVSAAAPMYDENMNFVGIISLGYNLENPEYVNKLSINTGCDVTFYRDDLILSTTMLNENGEPAIGHMADEEISEVVLAGDTFKGSISLFGRNYLVNYAPIFGIDNRIIGMIAVAHDTYDDIMSSMFFITSGGFVTILFLIICVIIASFISKIVERRLSSMADDVREANERVMLMLDTSPLCTQILDKELKIIDCNESAVKLFGFEDKSDYIANFTRYCFPEFQPDGTRSDEKAAEYLTKAFNEGFIVFEWMNKLPADNTEIPCEITAVLTKYNNEEVVLSYTRDLRDHYKMLGRLEEANFTRSAMFDSNPHVNVLFDSDFNIIDCNPEALKFFGFNTKEEFIEGFVERLMGGIPEVQTDGTPTVPMFEGLKRAAIDGEIIIDLN